MNHKKNLWKHKILTYYVILRIIYFDKCNILVRFNDITIYLLVIELDESNKRIIGAGLRNPIPFEKSLKLVIFFELRPQKTEMTLYWIILMKKLKI